jgi:hypothetical protein
MADEPTVITAEQELNRIRFARAFNRRRFIQTMGLGTGVVTASAMLGCGSDILLSAQGTAPSEPDVLNFALNLEYLEAEFYLIAVDGARLSAGDTGNATGATSGGQQVVFGGNTQARDIADEIKQDEVDHVRFLRSALGAAAAPKPAINLDALGLGFSNVAEFLALARAFEDTGVSAYNGAAGFLAGPNLEAAAAILATEAYHAGNVRLQVVQAGATVPSVDAKDQPPTGMNFFPTDQNGLALRRTPSEVLSILYASTTPGTSSGGFFPQGLNGNIKTI